MNSQMKKSDYLLLLPSLVPIIVLFLVPLVYAFQLIFTTPERVGGQPVYTDNTYEYHYSAGPNRFLQIDTETGAETGLMLTPFEVRSQSDEYKVKASIGIQNIKTFFTERRYYISIYNTLALVLPATLIQIALAFSMAYFLRGKIKGKMMYKTLIIFPLTLGSLIIAGGMTNFFRAGGWFNTALMALDIINEPLTILFTYWGTLIAVIIGGTPFLFSGFLPICESIDPNLETAAKTLGANGLKTFTKVFLPLAIPSMISIISLNMVLNMATYPSAVLVGDPTNTTRVLTVVAFEEFRENMNFNMAATAAFVLVIMQASLMAILQVVRKRFYIGFGGSFK